MKALTRNMSLAFNFKFNGYNQYVYNYDKINLNKKI